MSDIFGSIAPQGSRWASPIGPFQGMLKQGNIDLEHRPLVRMPDGSFATVRSISNNFGNGEVLYPSVSPNGAIMSDRDAKQQLLKSGQFLGVFDTPEHSDAYAQALHLAQAMFYGLGGR